MTDTMDSLVLRLRERAADPAQRTDDRPSQFGASIAVANLADLLSMGRSLSLDLQRLVANGPSPDITARTSQLQASMQTPAERTLPGVATAAQVTSAERRLGVALPPLLRRLYLEVANGGFGPGPGIVGVAGGWTTDHGKTIEDTYDEMLDATTENRRWVWPPALVPIVDFNGVFACVDCATVDGRIVEFDFEELDGRGRDGGWSRAFADRAPSLAAWLDDWLTSARPPERPQFMIGMPPAGA